MVRVVNVESSLRECNILGFTGAFRASVLDTIHACEKSENFGPACTSGERAMQESGSKAFAMYELIQAFLLKQKQQKLMNRSLPAEQTPTLSQLVKPLHIVVLGLWVQHYHVPSNGNICVAVALQLARGMYILLWLQEGTRSTWARY